MSDKLKLVYTVLVLPALVYAERRLIEPRLTGARLSALVQEALVYKVLVYQEWHRENEVRSSPGIHVSNAVVVVWCHITRIGEETRRFTEAGS